jgi:1,4-dihydroxy-2-naphthoate polyprenyltransferase
MASKLKSFATELRAPFLTATVVSIVLGTSISWARNGVFDPGFFLFSLLAGSFLHLGTNVANDYFDHKSGGDDINKDFVRPFGGGSRMIQLGLLKPREVLLEAFILCIAGTVIGIYLAFSRGLFILALGLFGLFSGIFYASPPFKLANRGVGEIFVGVNFGLLMTLGAYYVQTQSMNAEPLVASIPVSLLIFAVVYINEFQDYNADKAIGKRTLVVRFGRKKAAYGYAILMCAAYLSIIIEVLSKITPSTTLIGLFTIPLAIRATIYAFRYHSMPQKLVPANASTILCHLLTSLLLSVGYLITFMVPTS